MPVDFAPGQDHIFVRRNQVPFYVPELFHLNPFFNRICPLLINDINTSHSMVSVYGSRGLPFDRAGVFLINNHPIKRIQVVGRILGEFMKDFDNVSKNFVVCSIDDASGNDSIISVKVSQSAYISSGFRPFHSYGLVLSAVGHLQSFHGHTEMVCERLECLGSSSDLAPQISHWQLGLQTRDRLQEPWEYMPHTVPGYVDPEPPYMSDGRRQLIEYITDETQEASSSEDSVRVTAPVHSPPSPEIIVISDDEEDIETDMNASFEDTAIEVLEYVHLPTPLVTEFQITVEVIRYLLSSDCKPTTLIELYQNKRINTLLHDLTTSRATLEHRGQREFLTLKHHCFHSIRHTLQKRYGLIITTKTQVVKPDNLLYLSDHIQRCLDSIRLSNGMKVFNVENYLRVYKMTYRDRVGDLDTKITNAIIDYLVDRDGDKHQWMYNSKSVEWKYIV